MEMKTSLFIGAALAVLVLLLVVFLLARRRRRLSPLTIRLLKPTLRPLSGRPEWFMDVVAEFVNNTSRPIRIGGVRSLASAPDKYLLEAKRILGTEAAHVRGLNHPPDIALRLPIEVPPGAPVEYRFHVLFTGRVRPLWHAGLFQLFAISMEGNVAEGRCPLTPPAGETAAP